LSSGPLRHGFGRPRSTTVPQQKLRATEGDGKSGQRAEQWRGRRPLHFTFPSGVGAPASAARAKPQVGLRFLEILEPIPSILDSTIYHQVGDMADPLSAAASVVGIAVPALHGTRLLLDDIQNIVDAPKAVASLKEDLLSVDMAIEALKAVQSSEWESLGQDVVKESKFAVSTCATVCDTFRNDLQRWTKHSENGKISWRDRANVGFFKQQRIKSLSEQLQNCKITVNAAVGIATLYAGSHPKPY
jgi:Fungal N-terminal domain of STAND proteins